MLDKLMDGILSKLETLDFENFDKIFSIAVKMAKNSQELQKELIDKYGEKRLLNINPYLSIKAKQIENKFDNLVHVFSEEKDRLERELKSFVSRKKLTNYKRYQNANQRTFK